MKNPIGIQIYTLRHRWREDFTGTLALLRKVGFESVEYVRNFERFTPEALAAHTRRWNTATEIQNKINRLCGAELLP